MTAQGNALGIRSRTNKNLHLGRTYLVTNRLGSPRLGLRMLVDFIPWTTSGATIGLARWAGDGPSTYV
jgi:hypothetical protein